MMFFCTYEDVRYCILHVVCRMLWWRKLSVECYVMFWTFHVNVVLNVDVLLMCIVYCVLCIVYCVLCIVYCSLFIILRVVYCVVCCLLCSVGCDFGILFDFNSTYVWVCEWVERENESPVDTEELSFSFFSFCPSQGRNNLWGEHNTHVLNRGLNLRCGCVEEEKEKEEEAEDIWWRSINFRSEFG